MVFEAVRQTLATQRNGGGALSPMRKAARNQSEHRQAVLSLSRLPRQIYFQNGGVYAKSASREKWREFASDLMDNPEMESGSPQQIPPNNQTGGEENHGDTKQVSAGYGNERKKSIVGAIFHDDFFRCLTGISIGCWMIHEFVFDVHKIFLFGGIIFTFADVFYVLAHKILPRRWWLIAASWLIYLAGMTAVFHFKNDSESILRSPILSQSAFQLGDGTYSFQNGATIFNPSDFPIFDVEVWFYINGVGISADSVIITTPIPRPSDAKPSWSDFTQRSDYLHDPTNQVIQFIIGEIPSNKHFYFEIAGGDSKKGYAEVKIGNYSTNAPQIFRAGISNIFYYPASKTMADGFLKTNFINGTRIVTTNIFRINSELKPIEEDASGKHLRFENY